jgi:hypothetical protein
MSWWEDIDLQACKVEGLVQGRLHECDFPEEMAMSIELNDVVEEIKTSQGGGPKVEGVVIGIDEGQKTIVADSDKSGEVTKVTPIQVAWGPDDVMWYAEDELRLIRRDRKLV